MGYVTKMDLPPLVRGQVARLLQQRLNDAIDLDAQLKHAHWNIKGPQFLQLHQLLDSVHDAIEVAVDLIAERIAALGGTADGRLKTAVNGSSLADYPPGLKGGAAHLDAVSGALSGFGSGVRQDIEVASHLGDAGTADLFTQLSRETDKLLWLVEAHLIDATNLESGN